jgi:hypothetical protein
MPRKIDELYYEIRAHVEDLSGDVDDAERLLSKLETFILAHPVAATAALVAGLIEVGVKAVEAAEETDTQMRAIAASLGQPLENLKELGDQLDDIANKAGRATSEVEAAAVQAAQQRPGTAPQDIANVVGAATTFADATGSDLNAAVTLLDRVMSEFDVDSSEGLDALAKIRAASEQGHIAVSDLAEAFVSAAPIASKYGLDMDTVLRAITSLISVHRLADAQQVGRILRQDDADTIRAYANEVTLATDETQKMTDAADRSDASAKRAAQTAKNELGQALRDIGTTLLPPVATGFQAIAAVLDAIAKWQLPSGSGLSALLKVAGALGIGDPTGLTQKYLAGAIDANTPSKASDWDSSGGHFGDKPPLKLNAQQTAQIENDLASITKLVADFGNSTNAVLAGVGQSAVDTALHEFETFAQKFDQAKTDLQNKLKQLQAATPNLPQSFINTFNAQMKQLNDDYAAGVEARVTKVNALASQEADDIRAKVGQALGAITGNLGELGLAQIQKQNDALREMIDLAFNIDDAEKARLKHDVDIAQVLEQQKLAADDAVKMAQQVSQAAAVTAKTDPSAALTAINDQSIKLHLLELQLIQDGQTKLGLSADEVKQGEGYKEIEAEIVALGKQRIEIGNTLFGQHKDVQDSLAHQLQSTIDMARAIQDGVGGALQLAEAFGAVDQRSASILGSIAQIATQIPVLAKGLDALNTTDPATGNPEATLSQVVGYALPIVGGIAALVSAFTAPNQQEQAHIKALEDNSTAIEQLTAHVATLAISGTSFQQGADLVAAALAEQATYAKSGTKIQQDLELNDQAILTPQQLEQLQDFAKTIGITFDGTVSGLKQLEEAAVAAGSALGKYGTDYQSEQSYYANLPDVLGLTGVDAFNVQALGPASQSPLLQSTFDGADLTTDAGRAAFKEVLQGLYERGAPTSANPLTPAELGGLTPDQFEQAIKQWIDTLNGLPPVVAAATDKLKADLGDLSQKASVLDEGPLAQLADKVATYGRDMGSALSGLADGLDLSKQDDIEKYKQRLQDFYQGISDGSIQVDTSVFSIDDWKSAIADLVGSVDSAASSFETAAQKISDAENQISISDDILGTSPTDSVQEYAKAYGYDLSGFDLTTQSGRDSAIATLQNVFRQLNPATTVDYDTVVHEIQSLIDKIRALPAIPGTDTTSTDAGAGAASDASAASSDVAESSAATVATQSSVDRMGDYLATILQVNRDELAAMQRLVDLFTTPIITSPLRPPALPASFGSGASAISAAVAINVELNGDVTITMDGVTVMSLDDVDKLTGQVLDQLSQKLTPRISKLLAEAFRGVQRRKGSTALPSS